jgi:metallo-beta-lactamase family protein
MNKLIFYGGVGATTGANIMLETAQGKILVDCGILQGVENAEEVNKAPFAFDPSEVSHLLITHAHMDHIGRVPKLVRDGFHGKIISTPQTRELALPMLHDALKVMMSRDPKNAFYEEADIKKALSLWDTLEYGKTLNLFEDVSVYMQNAGHILGSAIINVTVGKKKYAFTGDLGNSPSPLLPDTEYLNNVDAIIMESVYGDRNHDPHEVRDANFKRAIEEGIKRGGAILIPAFSIERTQVILYELNNLIEDGHIPSIPVYIDSPLAAQVTDIYKRNEDLFKLEVQREIKAGDDIFNFPKLKITRSVQDAKEIHKVKGPKIILAGSGMSEGGRVLGHEAELLPHPENTIILVGFQAMGTVGRRIEEGSKVININHQNIKVRAHVENIRGFSSHKDSDHLLEFVDKSVYGEKGIEGTESDANVKKPKVFVIMGEPKSSLFLAQRIREYLDIEAVYPEALKEYEI